MNRRIINYSVRLITLSKLSKKISKSDFSAKAFSDILHEFNFKDGTFEIMNFFNGKQQKNVQFFMGNLTFK